MVVPTVERASRSRVGAPAATRTGTRRRCGRRSARRRGWWNLAVPRSSRARWPGVAAQGARTPSDQWVAVFPVPWSSTRIRLPGLSVSAPKAMAAPTIPAPTTPGPPPRR